VVKSIPRPNGKKNPNTCAQVMEEIIAKSKMYKAIKAKQREDDEDELEKVGGHARCLRLAPEHVLCLCMGRCRCL